MAETGEVTQDKKMSRCHLPIVVYHYACNVYLYDPLNPKVTHDRSVADQMSVSPETPGVATLETTHGQIDGFSSQLLFKSYLQEVVSVGD